MEGYSGEEASWEGQPHCPVLQRHRAGRGCWAAVESRAESTNAPALHPRAWCGLGQSPPPGWASGSPPVEWDGWSQTSADW